MHVGTGVVESLLWVFGLRDLPLVRCLLTWLLEVCASAVFVAGACVFCASRVQGE